MSDWRIVHQTITCDYLTPNGCCESVEILTAIGFYKRMLNVWSVLEEQVHCLSKDWPEYVCRLFWNDSLSDVQCGQLAAFIVVNSITSSAVVQWFALVGLAKKNRQAVFDMVNRILTYPQNFTFVFAFCGRSEQHVQVESIAYCPYWPENRHNFQGI